MEIIERHRSGVTAAVVVVLLTAVTLLPVRSDESSHPDVDGPEGVFYLDGNPETESVFEAWSGYPLRGEVAHEREVEAAIDAIRDDAGRGELAWFEELRFLGRAHIRAFEPEKHEKEHEQWGYMADRAAFLFGWTPYWTHLVEQRTFPDKFRVGEIGSRKPESEGGDLAGRWEERADMARFLKMTQIQCGGVGILPGYAGRFAFGGIPRDRWKQLQTVNALGEKLLATESSKGIEKGLKRLARVGDGSTMIWAIPYLKHDDEDVAETALDVIASLAKRFPKAHVAIFGLVDYGLSSPHEKIAEESQKLLEELTDLEQVARDGWYAWIRRDWQRLQPERTPDD